MPNRIHPHPSIDAGAARLWRAMQDAADDAYHWPADPAALAAELELTDDPADVGAALLRLIDAGLAVVDQAEGVPYVRRRWHVLIPGQVATIEDDGRVVVRPAFAASTDQPSYHVDATTLVPVDSVDPWASDATVAGSVPAAFGAAFEVADNDLRGGTVRLRDRVG